MNNIDTTLYGTNSTTILKKKNWAGYAYSTNDQCGPDYNNTACPNNACCSSHGWCGYTADYCGSNSVSNGRYNDTNILYNNDNDLENRLYFTLLNKNIKKCDPLTSTNMSNCNDFYKNAPTNISNRINSEYTNASSYVYSNPVDAKFTDFPTLDDTQCTPAYAKNRTQTVSASYTFPIINIHNTFITTNFTTANIQSIKNLKINENTTITNISNTDSIKFTRINDSYPEQYTLAKILNCNSKAYRTQETINTLWTQTTGCSNTLNSNILTNLGTSYDDLQYNTVNDVDVTNKFSNRYSTQNIYKTISDSNDRITDCYGSGNYITFTRNNIMDTSGNYLTNVSLPSKMTRGVKFSTINGNIPVLKNGSWTLWLLTTGNLLIMYGNESDSKSTQVTNINQSNYTHFTLTFEYNGYVSIHKNGDTYMDGSGTGYNDARFLQLTSFGNIKILNESNVSIRLVWSNALGYLKYVFYDNCPSAMFADKAGRVFKFTWSDYTKGKFINDIPSDGGGYHDELRGWSRAGDNNEWKVTERNLVNINGYDTELNLNQPVVGDDNTINYRDSSDRNNFYTDCCKTGTLNVRKPKQFSTGGTDKTNYIPGYIRISYVDGTGGNGYSYKFLVLSRSGWNQSFVLFQKYHSNVTFANDVFANHPDLITLLNNN